MPFSQNHNLFPNNPHPLKFIPIHAMPQKTITQSPDSLYTDSQDNAFLGYPSSPSLISTADPDFEEASEPVAKVPATKKPKVEGVRKAKRKRSSLETLLVGLDLGTNKTCVQIAEPGAEAIEASALIPTVVGYSRPGILPDVLPGNQTTFFGDEAIAHKLHLDLIQPLKDGVVEDLEAVRDFLGHVKERIGNSEDTEYRAVIGTPANAGPQAKENIRLAVTQLFDKVILIPEPFLAALGSRKESTTGIDPVTNSIFVDIGAGSTDVCLIQGYYPSSDDQISFAFAGDTVDRIIQKSILAKYPDCGISVSKCREIKETYSFVNGSKNSILAPVMIRGKVKRLEVADAIDTACNALLEKIYQAVRTLIMRADPESIPTLLENIIVTGGGSMIPGFDEGLESLLLEEGFEGCKVTCVGESYKSQVAAGALIAAHQADERQWQNLLR